MKAFDTAYLRLTGWYVAIIMAISLLFSVWVYNQARQELRFGLSQAVPMTQTIDGLKTWAPNIGVLLDQRLNDSRNRLIVRLVVLNAMVLLAGAFASYWLARRTMRPVEESVEAQHRFTADASHELRTPLAAMKAEIEVGLRDQKLTKDEAVHLLQSNLEEIDRLSNLAEGLLTLSQTDQPATLQPLELEEAAGAVTKRMQPLADAKHISLERQLEPAVVLGDQVAIDKIIGILLDNAIKYSGPNTTIVVRAGQRDGRGYLAVQDQGVGIKAGELPHIFDRFYRADTSRSKQHVPGHGLGLSIAQKLAENLDATIVATSAPGKGSTFTLRLPLP
jgi:two-component system, OmpR family, sensor histidine kinase CiaH